MLGKTFAAFQWPVQLTATIPVAAVILSRNKSGSPRSPGDLPAVCTNGLRRQLNGSSFRVIVQGRLPQPISSKDFPNAFPDLPADFADVMRRRIC